MKQRSIAPIPLATAIFMAVAALYNLGALCLGLGYLPSSQIFTHLLGFGVYTFFAVLLFFRRRDFMLPVAAGALCLLNIISLFWSFATFWNFLGAILMILASLGLLAWAVCAVIGSLFDYQSITERLWFLPGLAAALGAFLHIAGSPFLSNLLVSLLTAAAYFLLSLTIVFPDGIPTRTEPGTGYVPPAGAQPFFAQEEPADLPPRLEELREEAAAVTPPWDGYNDMLKHTLLLIFTFGVWYLIWIYRTTGYLNQVEEDIPRTPVYQLLLCLFVPFYVIYWVYKSAQRLDILAPRKGVTSDLRIVCLVVAFFVPILPPILMQDKMNLLSGRVSSGPGQPVPPTGEALAADLRACKALLEDGLISSEDYEAKKKQLLGL